MLEEIMQRGNTNSPTNMNKMLEEIMHSGPTNSPASNNITMTPKVRNSKLLNAQISIYIGLLYIVG